MDKNTKNLINDLNKYYKFQINQIGENSCYFWTLDDNRDFQRKKFIFFESKENSQVDRVINKINDENVKYVKVVCVTEAYEYKPKNENIIIYNSKVNAVIYASDNVQNEVTEMLNIINYQKAQHKEKRQCIITYILIALNIIMFLISVYLSKSIIEINPNVLEALGAKDNVLISEGQYYRLFTSMFLHSGIVHIGMNMYSLFMIGPLIEKSYGKVKYILIYFLSGILASITSYMFTPAMSIGASGAIFGVLGATLVLAYKLRKIVGKEFLVNVSSVIAVNIVFSFSIPNIDMYAHIGGLVSGILFSIIFYKNSERTL